MLFEVLTGSGLGGNAAMSGNRNATKMQTEQEHMDLLDIRNQPGYEAWKAMPPGPAKSAALMQLRLNAEEWEKAQPQYWKEDNLPRRSITQSSSYIGNIQYEPRTNTANIQMGNKIYQYPNVTPDGMYRFLNSNMEDYLKQRKPYSGQGF